MNIILTFLTGFVTKFLTTAAIENVVLILLEKLVKSTKSDVDNELYEAVFKKIK